MLLASALISLCGLMIVPGDQDVTLEGVLLFDQHDSRLQDRVHGTLVKGGGFGYRGVYRMAILAKKIEFASER
jgi:hypothetical protein